MILTQCDVFKVIYPVVSLIAIEMINLVPKGARTEECRSDKAMYANPFPRCYSITIEKIARIPASVGYRDKYFPCLGMFACYIASNPTQVRDAVKALIARHLVPFFRLLGRAIVRVSHGVHAPNPFMNAVVRWGRRSNAFPTACCGLYQDTEPLSVMYVTNQQGMLS
jgi:hypothetical protein